jgi:hypothetical protein
LYERSFNRPPVSADGVDDDPGCTHEADLLEKEEAKAAMLNKYLLAQAPPRSRRHRRHHRRVSEA